MTAKLNIITQKILLIAFAMLIAFGIGNNVFAGDKNPPVSPVTDQISSDLQGITISVTYDTNYSHTDYIAASGSSAQDTGHYANQKGIDRGFVRFACTNETVDKFIIKKEKISTVIKTKYNMGIFDRTDFVFTEDSLYVINSVQNDGKLYTSTVYVLPSLDSKYEYQTYLSGGNAACGVNKQLVFKILDFCAKHDLKY